MKEYTNNRYNNTFNIINEYDSDDNLINQTISLNNNNHNVNYIFNKEKNLLESFLDNVNVKYNYDELLRIIRRKLNNSYETKYEYLTIGNRTSNLIKKLINISMSLYLISYWEVSLQIWLLQVLRAEHE